MMDGLQPGMSRRSVLQMLAGTAVAGAIPVVATGHPILRHLADESHVVQAQAKAAAPGWTPQFLDRHQFETLQSLAERVLPGASRARTSEFIDQLLAVDAHEDQQKFLSALGAFEGQATARAGQPWKALPESEQIAILTGASTMSPGRPPGNPWTKGDPIEVPTRSSDVMPMTLRDHFNLLKGWIAGAYYSSEIGMKELGWTGTVAFESFPGCEHPDGHA
jgi:hypothetical protein